MQDFKDVLTPTPSDWVQLVLDNFDSFLQDHANNERKVSSMAMSFVAKYPDRVEIISRLILIAKEELDHFAQVYAIMEERGVQLEHSIGEDLYMKKLIKTCRTGRDERFMDRLLIASVVEARGREKFKMVAEALEGKKYGKFYKELWINESRHADDFIKMALQYFDEKIVRDRYDFWLKTESEISAAIPMTFRMH